MSEKPSSKDKWIVEIIDPKTNQVKTHALLAADGKAAGEEVGEVYAAAGREDIILQGAVRLPDFMRTLRRVYDMPIKATAQRWEDEKLEMKP